MTQQENQRRQDQAELDNAINTLTRSKHERKARRTAPSTQPGKAVSAYKHLVIIRESAKKSLKVEGTEASEFEKMANHTLLSGAVKNLEGVEQIRAVAKEIVGSDSRAQELREKFGAETLYDNRLVIGYKIIIGEVIYLLCVYSAAKVNIRVNDNIINMDNAFTLAVARLVNQYNIKHLYIGRFDRLVRHQTAMSELITALSFNKTKVYAEGAIYDMGVDSGKDSFRIQGLVGEKTYLSAVSNLTNGWYELVEDGQWPKAESHLPAIGYKFRGDNDRVVVPDTTKIDLVRDIIEWAADETLTDYDIAVKLAEKWQYKSEIKASRGEHPEGILITELRYPQTAVRNLLRRGLPLWSTGSYSYKAAVPYHIDEGKINSRSKHRVEELDAYTRQVSWDIDFHHELLPEGRWVENEKIGKAMKRITDRTEKKARGRQASRHIERKPMSGIVEWVDGETQYHLSARNSRNYKLISRPACQARDDEGRSMGWTDEERANIIAVINPKELHEALADTIVEAIDSKGVSWNRLVAFTSTANSAASADVARIDELSRMAEAVQAEIEDAELDIKMAKEIEAYETAKERMKVAEAKRREHAALISRIAQARASVNDMKDLRVNAHANVSDLVAALAALRKTENQAPAELNLTLRHILCDTRMEKSDDNLKVKVTTNVRVTSDDGVVILGPITATVKNAQQELKASRSELILALVLRDGKTMAEVGAEIEFTDLDYVKHLAMDQLKSTGVVPSKGLRSALIDCPIADVKRVVWAEIEARSTGKAFRVPAGIDSSYAAHVRSTYVDPDLLWTLSWASDNPERARNAVELVSRSEDPEVGVLWNGFIEAVSAGITHPSSIRYLNEELVLGKGLNNDKTSKGNRVAYEPIVERLGEWHRHNKTRSVRLRQCPNCNERTLTHIIRVPEVSGGLLCTSCRKAPSLPTVTFPEDYLRNWTGPRGHGSRNQGPYVTKEEAVSA